MAILLSCTYSLSQQGLKAEYYDGTDFNRLESVQYVKNINQSWYDTPPVPNIDPHACSIRWTGILKPGKSGIYSFSAQVDDGIRVWINDKMIIDQWDLNDLGIFKGTIDLDANEEYDLKVEYFNGMLEGEVRLLWKKHKEDLSWYERIFGDGIEFSVIPSEHFLRPEEPVKVKKELVEQVVQKAKTKPAKKKPKTILVNNETSVRRTVQKPTTSKPEEIKISSPSKTVTNAKDAEKFIPKNIQFEKGKTKIVESSYEELNAFIQFMLDHPHLKVNVEGHTDVIGDAELNLQLSKDRAEVISEYLIEKGVNRERIKSVGYGGTRPLIIPKKGKYYPANRRVVFIIEGF